MPCKHAHLALIYAQQMAVMNEPWELWRCRTEGEKQWFYHNRHFPFYDNVEYELIPKTIQIGIHFVPEPMREKPEIGATYYVVDAIEEDGGCERLWADDNWDNLMFSRGQCHLTRENCIIHAKALFSLTQREG